MSWLRNSSVLWAMGLLATLAPACSSTEEATEEDDEGALSTVTISKPGDWVVDMKKVKAAYCGGQSCTSKYFFGLAPHEAGLCKVDAQGQPAAACAAMEQQGLIVWDQAFRYKDDHSLVAPTDKTPVVRLEGSEANTSVKGLRLNIIPMLKETDPLDQKHIAEWMQNGDVMVYFHPEQSDQKSLMDRRTSHVAMYYEYKDAQGKVIARHHIDNPNNYGPQFNHSPDRQMPFHIFRYRPKGMSAETSRAVGLNARNWGFITDDRSPFADFFDLRLQTVADLRTFKEKALKGEDIPARGVRPCLAPGESRKNQRFPSPSAEFKQYPVIFNPLSGVVHCKLSPPGQAHGLPRCFSDARFHLAVHAQTNNKNARGRCAEGLCLPGHRHASPGLLRPHE